MESGRRHASHSKLLCRSGDDLINGLFVELDAWQWHMFRIDVPSDSLPR
jgi:hypothetical protein